MKYSLKNDLYGSFLKVIRPGFRRTVDDIADAHGVMFLCPLCYEKNNGPIGTHSIICWSADAGAPDDEPPLPGRWKLSGKSLDDLTLDGERGKSRSVLLLDGCKWHGFVTNGVVE